MSTITRHKDELYGSGAGFRLISTYGSHGTRYDVRLSWGSFKDSGKTVSQLSLSFGIREACLLAATQGSERWWRDLNADQLRTRLKRLRRSADNAGFEFLGEDR